MSQIAKHWFVKGKVQGVWFRASTAEVAKQIGVRGWVRNLPDGRVEVLACGTSQQLTELHDYLSHGPRLARVDELLVEEVPLTTDTDFTVK